MKKQLAFGLLLAGATLAFAQQSEFQQKLQDDLDGMKRHIVSGCKMSDKLEAKWTGGKLAGNPRETLEGDYTSVSTLCKSALDAYQGACVNNKVVNAKTKHVKTIACTRGKGTLSFTLKGDTLTFLIDTKFDKNNPAGQRDDLDKKLRAKLDD